MAMDGHDKDVAIADMQQAVGGASHPSPSDAASPLAMAATKPRNQCGNCTLFCKTVGVEELRKPLGEWCPHCLVGKGCKIYDTRPAECRQWDCMWLSGAFGDQPDLPPDRCKVVCGYQAGFITVTEDAAPRQAGLRLVNVLIASGKPVIIKRLGQPGFRLANATMEQAIEAGVIAKRG